MSGRIGQRSEVGQPALSFGRSDIKRPIVVSASPGASSNSPGDGYTYYDFTASGTFVISDGEGAADVIVVGGGGGGGQDGRYPSGAPVPSGVAYWTSGGGGAGGVIATTLYLTPGTYPVTVGAGGAAKTRGTNTVFSALTAVGGGSGGGISDIQSTPPVPSPTPYFFFVLDERSPSSPVDAPLAVLNNLFGASTGGRSGALGALSGIPGQGNSGAVAFGYCNSASTNGCGGGGAGVAGGPGPQGGNGLELPQAPPVLPSKYFGGGGGGGTPTLYSPSVFPSPTSTNGGLGGGGSGGYFKLTEFPGSPSPGFTATEFPAISGTANTGGGGGGSGMISYNAPAPSPPLAINVFDFTNASSGGSGRVIIRIRNNG